MLNTVARFSILLVLLAGCAHRGAVRVECEGPLRPINRSAQLKDAPASVVPGNPQASTPPEKRSP